MAQTSTDGTSLVRTRLRQQIISERAWDIIMESWRTGTTKRYRVYLDKWKNFVRKTHANPIHPTLANVINFLTHFYDTGSSFSAFNTARSALSAAVDIANSPYTVGEHPMIKRFVKVAFQSRPSFPIYQSIRDVSKVLDLLGTWSRHFSIPLFPCKLALMTSLSNVKFKRIFNLERGHKGQYAWKHKNAKMVAILE